MNRTLARASLVASSVALLAACSPIQTVSYPVREPNGTTANVDKYFSSLTPDDPGDRAFKQIQAGHTDEALATLKAAEASEPTDSSYHYDLAIIYEIKADWPAALTEIRDAKRLAPTDKMYGDEEAFVVKHAGK